MAAKKFEPSEASREIAKNFTMMVPATGRDFF